MSDHLQKQEIDDYGRRALSAERAAVAVRHLAECTECMEEYRAMFPNAVTAGRGIAVGPGVEFGAEPFHLDFDEHLRPYVDERISEIDREIVEGHAGVCPHCAGLLRDLQEFRERIAHRHADAAPRPGLLERIYSAVTFRPLALAFVLLMAVGVGLSLWYLTSGRPGSKLAVDGPSMQPSAAEQVAPVDIGEPASAENREVTATVPPSEIPRLRVPTFLAGLRLDPPGGFRGEQEARPLRVLSANGTVHRSTPALSWTGVAGVSSYEVSLFDENHNSLRPTSAVTTPHFMPNGLAKGRVYQWQVTAIGTDNIKHIGQGRFYIISEVEEAKIAGARTPLAKGKALAEAGLLREAVTELRRIPSSDADRRTADAWLRQLGSR